MPLVLLPNGCSFTEPCIFPSNWKSVKATVKKPWYINYRFHDPHQSNQFPKGKLISIRGMNHYVNQNDRMVITEQLLNNELSKLKVQGYNPISGLYDTPDESSRQRHSILHAV